MAITKVEASYTSNNGVTGVKWHAGEASITIGNLNDNSKTQWTFTEEDPLIGVYGNYSSNRINKLGFLTLNSRCQAGEETEERPVDGDTGGESSSGGGNTTGGSGTSTGDGGSTTGGGGTIDRPSDGGETTGGCTQDCDVDAGSGNTGKDPNTGSEEAGFLDNILGEQPDFLVLIIFFVAILVAACIIILLIRCCIKKCSGPSKPKSDVEVTKIGAPSVATGVTGSIQNDKDRN